MLLFFSAPLLISFKRRGPEKRTSQNHVEFSHPLIEVKGIDMLSVSSSRALPRVTYVRPCCKTKAPPVPFSSLSAHSWILSSLCSLWKV